MLDSNHEILKAFKVCFKGISSTFDEIAREFLYGHFPDLNEKEYIVCQVLASAYHDIEWGYYKYIVDVTADYYHEIFGDRKEVESTIQELIEKGTIQYTPVKEERELRLKDDLQDELVGAWRIEYESTIKEVVASTNAWTDS